MCVGHVIQTRDRGVFVLHGCYQERKTAERKKKTHFIVSRFARTPVLIAAEHKAELPAALCGGRELLDGPTEG